MLEATYADLSEQDQISPEDRVVLAKGPYQGTPGVLLRLERDVAWATVREWDGKIRCHPVSWLRRQS